MNHAICSFPPQDEFPAADESVDEFPSVLKWRSKPAVASMSVSLPNLLGKSSSNLSVPDTPVDPEQILEGDKSLQTTTALLGTESKAAVRAARRDPDPEKNTHHQFHLLLLRGRRERSRIKAALIAPKPPENLSGFQNQSCRTAPDL